LEQAHLLGPNQDASELIAFLQRYLGDALEELDADPGHDLVRAIVLRALGALVHGEARAEACRQASSAIKRYPTDLQDMEPTVSLLRQPAWVALARLELGRLEDTEPDVYLKRAVELASEGFAAVSKQATACEGTILWAIAEQASELSWHDWTQTLLSAALETTFEDDTHRGDVTLLLAFAEMETSPKQGIERLQSVWDDSHAKQQTRVHAAWVLAASSREDDDTAAALRWLTSALALIDSTQEPEVHRKLSAAMDELKH
jgi:hypothetical protein